VPPSSAGPQRFRAKIDGTEKGRVYLALPFDPAGVWGERSRYHLRGTIDGRPFRGAAEPFAKGHLLALGPAYREGTGLGPGDVVEVVLEIEGPQRDALAPDLAAALEAEPEAGRFFDALASFYRKNYLRWIEATKRRPDVRAARIAELVELLRTGHKQRPQ